MTRERLVWGFLVVFLIVMLFLLKECNGKQSELIKLQNQVLTDSLKVTENKLGQQTATIGLIQTNFSTFKKLTFAKEDSLGHLLQKMVNRRTISATIATTEMAIDIVEPTDLVTFSDPIDTCNPTYIFSDTTEYRQMNIVADKDSFRIKQRIFERLEFTQEFSKWRMFKPTVATTSFKNYNPDVTITGLRTYTTNCNCKGKFWTGFVLGALGGNGSGFLGGWIYGKR